MRPAKIGRFIRARAVAGAIMASLALGEGQSARGQSQGVVPDSPRLAKLARELAAGNRTALAAFWQEIGGHTPLVEPVSGQDRSRRVTFLWSAGPGTLRVALLGGLPSPIFVKPLARLRDTDLWYRSEVHPVEARFEYAFLVNLPEKPTDDPDERNQPPTEVPSQPDPLNPRSYEGSSYVELPGAPPQPWIVRQPNVPHGKLTRQPFKSQILKATYPLRLYTPPGYDPRGRRCWLMIAFDGGFPLMEATLDNLLAAGKIPPLVVVGVGNISGESRMRDLGCSEAFARFLTTELVPWARQRYRVYGDAAHTIVSGISRGGLMAAYCGLNCANVFGKVLVQSGSFGQPPGLKMPGPIWTDEPPDLLTRQFANRPRQPVEFYMEAGQYETGFAWSLLMQNRRLRDVLKAKGYRVTYSEFVGGHDGVCWRGSVADALMSLTAERKP